MTASAMLLYMLYGSPSLAASEFIQLCTFGAALYIGVALYERTEKLFPLSLAVGCMGLLELVGRLDPHGQAMLHWAMITLLAVSGTVILRGRRPRADVLALRDEVGALQSQLREALESNEPEHVLGTTSIPPAEYFSIVLQAYSQEKLDGDPLLNVRFLDGVSPEVKAEFEERVGRLLQRERLMSSIEATMQTSSHAPSGAAPIWPSGSAKPL